MTSLHLTPSSPQPVSQLLLSCPSWGVSCRHQGGSKEMPQSRAPPRGSSCPVPWGAGGGLEVGQAMARNWVP